VGTRYKEWIRGDMRYIRKPSITEGSRASTEAEAKGQNSGREPSVPERVPRSSLGTELGNGYLTVPPPYGRTHEAISEIPEIAGGAKLR
jgi:hypothetical protein